MTNQQPSPCLPSDMQRASGHGDAALCPVLFTPLEYGFEVRAGARTRVRAVRHVEHWQQLHVFLAVVQRRGVPVHARRDLRWEAPTAVRWPTRQETAVFAIATARQDTQASPALCTVAVHGTAGQREADGEHAAVWFAAPLQDCCTVLPEVDPGDRSWMLSDAPFSGPVPGDSEWRHSRRRRRA